MASSLFGVLALAAGLSLPAPGTDSRARHFCEGWLELPTPSRRALLAAADARETPDAPAEARCREARRPYLRRELDEACRGWSALMDFEVRALVDGILAGCTRTGAPAS